MEAQPQGPPYREACKHLIEGHGEASEGGGAETEVAPIEKELANAPQGLLVILGGHNCQEQVFTQAQGRQSC